MPFTSFTLLQLLDRLTDRWENVPFWTKEEGISALAESMRVFNSLTGYWRGKTTVTVSANNYWVDLPQPIAYNVRVTLADGTPLDRTSLSDIDNGRPNWENETTATGGSVPSALQLWMPGGCTMLAVWPRPITDTDIIVDGVLDTPVLALDTDTLNASDSEIKPLLDMALHVALFKEGGDRWKHGQQYYKAFLVAVADQNVRFKTSEYYRRAMGLDENRPRRPQRAALEAQLNAR